MSGAGSAIDSMSMAKWQRPWRSASMVSSPWPGIQPTRTDGASSFEPPPERLHQDEIADLARGHGEIALRVARVEGLCRPEQALHAGEDHMDGGGELERLGRRHEPLAGAHEQLVGEDFPKLGKGMADGRSAPPKPLGGPGDARIDEQRVEDHEQIGVDFFQMHDVQIILLKRFHYVHVSP